LLAFTEASLGHLARSDEALRDARALATRLGSMHRLHLVIESAVTLRAYLYGGNWRAIRTTASRALQVAKDHPSPVGQVVLANATLVEAFSPADGDYCDRIDALLQSLECTDLGVYGANAALALGVYAIWQREDVKRAGGFEALVRSLEKRGITLGPAGDAREFLLGRLAALQGQASAVRAHFANARGDLDRAGQACVRALVDLDDAIVAGALGDEPAWRALLRRAREQFDMLDMTFWRACADRAQTAGPRVTPRNIHARGPDDLSPREMEILGKLAAGDRPKIIAADLRLSAATVNRHIANIYTKIGVSSRAAATAYAARRRLVPLQ
jgi:DNA-binding CsgD family transcriptional regulator